MGISFFALGILTAGFKIMSNYYNISTWEDIYARSLVFLICSCLEYVYQKNDISIFDLKHTIRVNFFLRILFISIAYATFMLAVAYTSSYLYLSLIVCMMPLTTKMIQKNTMHEKRIGYLDLAIIAGGLVGLGLLYSPDK